MPPLPQPRNGRRLQIKQRPIPFSFWPSRPARSHHALQSLLFSLDPWAVIDELIDKKCPRRRRDEAFSCIEQAKDFYTVGTERGILAARPLVIYYSFMNLVKAFCLTYGPLNTFDHAQHGISERLRPGGKELTDAYLRAFPTPNSQGQPNNFAEFQRAITGASLITEQDFDLSFLLPQIVPGHRLWAQAAKKTERFIAVHDIHYFQDLNNQNIWLRLYFIADDLSRLSVTHQRLVSESGLGDLGFREVSCADQYEGRDLLCLEQITQVSYTKAYPSASGATKCGDTASRS
jgi:hypothetical protein